MRCALLLLLVVVGVVMTVLLPATSASSSSSLRAGGDESAADGASVHLRHKRQQGLFTADGDESTDSLVTRLANYRKQSCVSGSGVSCEKARSALKVLGLFFHKPLSAQYGSHTKKGCAFSLGNHCLTESLDNAATEYGYLQSGSSPGKRRRRSGRSGESEGSGVQLVGDLHLPNSLASKEEAFGEEV